MRTKITEPGQGVLEREAAQLESEATFRRLAEALGSAIFICEGEQPRYINHAAETIPKYTREELLTMKFEELVYPGSRELVVSRGPIHQENAEFPPQSESNSFANAVCATPVSLPLCYDVLAMSPQLNVRNGSLTRREYGDAHGRYSRSNLQVIAEVRESACCRITTASHSYSFNHQNRRQPTCRHISCGCRPQHRSRLRGAPQVEEQESK